MKKAQQSISALLDVAFDTRNLPFGQRCLILGSAAKAAGFTLFHSGHGKHNNVVHFELYKGRRAVACFA